MNTKELARRWFESVWNQKNSAAKLNRDGNQICQQREGQMC